MGTTGGALKWFVEKFCPDLTGPDRYRILDQEAGRAGTGAHGLVGLTGLSGERAPLWNPAARGVLFGLDLRHGRGEVARAILESVALMIREMVEILEGMGVGVKRLQVVGGGAVRNAGRAMIDLVLPELAVAAGSDKGAANGRQRRPTGGEGPYWAGR